jgi:two-component system chemotaxis response regulator CheY
MKRILVVDDAPSVRQQVAIALTQKGYQVVEAGDGLEALQRLAASPVNLIICDVNMPRMNGLEMIERVKADPRNGGLPIIMLTSEGQPALIERAKKAGAKCWIVKPFNATLLVAAVDKLAV